MGHITLVGSSDTIVRDHLRPLLQALPDATSASVELHAPPSPERGHSHPNPLIGIVMGSDSDLPVMLPAARILDALHIIN